MSGLRRLGKYSKQETTLRLREIQSGGFAPLYHVMDIRKAMAVFRDDALMARWQHWDAVGRQRLRGNSFSRNPRMSVRVTDCVRITVDQDRVRRRHRIVPMDADYAFEILRKFHDPETDTVNWEELEDYWDSMDYPENLRDRIKHADEQQWQEEFVTGDIRPLHRYLTRIEVNYQPHPLWSDMAEVIEDYAGRFSIDAEIDEPPETASVSIPQAAPEIRPLIIPYIPKL